MKYLNSESIQIPKGEFALIKLGVGMKLPVGFEAHISPRGSTCKNFGIIQANSVGVVDESYCGNNDQWMMPVVAIRDTSIEVGDRICQFRIVEKMKEIEFDEVNSLDSSDRGGFGSTGKKEL
jgi:dUTP pyrophosphatase